MEMWGGGSTNGGGTSVSSQNSAAVQVHKKQAESGQVVWSAFKAALAPVGAAAISHEFSKRMLNGKTYVGGDESKAKGVRYPSLESQNMQVFFGLLKEDT